MSDDERDPAARRTFLKQAAALAGAASVLGAVATSGESRAADLPADAAPFAGYEFFGPEDAAFVEALLNVMCPADQYTPNGVDCGLATFFDRQLAGPFGQGKGRYMRGPWNPGPPEMGLQLPLTPAQFFKVGLNAADDASVRRFAKPFAQLPAAAADAFLRELQDGHLNSDSVSLGSWFNSLVYPLFVQACFSTRYMVATTTRFSGKCWVTRACRRRTHWTWCSTAASRIHRPPIQNPCSTLAEGRTHGQETSQAQCRHSSAAD